MKWFNIYARNSLVAVVQANRKPTVFEVEERLPWIEEVGIQEASTPQVWYLPDGWQGSDASKVKGVTHTFRGNTPEG